MRDILRAVSEERERDDTDRGGEETRRKDELCRDGVYVLQYDHVEDIVDVLIRQKKREECNTRTNEREKERVGR